MEKVIHTFEPVFDARSKILIVGTMPSVLSRQEQFYYGNPRNRFYDVLSALFKHKKPASAGEKKAFLLKHNIALYDVLAECEIKGSMDASIKNARPNDFSGIFAAAAIKRVYANGNTAYKYYKRFIGEDVTCLPSTSPANAAYSLERLIGEWAQILDAME
ncbi:MAG: DNA-deoxyinosine glycosylase [Christensenellaceae bacterium]|jgi:TDG/mug DNA glycosylase family protein